MGKQTQQEFCKEKDIDYNQFQYWLRRYKRVNDFVSEQKSYFERIKVSVESANASAMELIFPMEGK